MQTDLFRETAVEPSIPVIPIPHCESHSNGIECMMDEPHHAGSHFAWFINSATVSWEPVVWNYSGCEPSYEFRSL